MCHRPDNNVRDSIAQIRAVLGSSTNLVHVAHDSPVAYMAARMNLTSSRIGGDIALDKRLHTLLVGHLSDVVEQKHIGPPINDQKYKETLTLIERLRKLYDETSDSAKRDEIQRDLIYLQQQLAKALHGEDFYVVDEKFRQRPGIADVYTPNWDVVAEMLPYSQRPFTYEGIRTFVLSFVRGRLPEPELEAIMGKIIKISLRDKAETDPQSGEIVKHSRAFHFLNDVVYYQHGHDFPTSDMRLYEFLRMHMNPEAFKSAINEYLQNRFPGRSYDQQLISASRPQGYPLDVEVQVLLDAGADPNAVDFDNQTALVNATRVKRIHTIKLLLAAGANPNKRVFNGMTALSWATFLRSPEIVQLLLEYKADPNIQFYPPLLTTASWRIPSLEIDRAIVRLLLAYGANKDVVDSSGRTAYDHADPNNTELRDLLRV